ncbi:MAG TPA: type II secretion system protein GspM [Thermodesulfobacteriota bacterium]|nr:type II secretion system protein GspM [Thermodesulfobacteriota bacterium]
MVNILAVIRSKWPFLKKMAFSQKKGIRWIGAAAVLILILTFGVLPLVDSVKKMKQEIFIKKKTLEKYEKFRQSRKTIEDELNQALRQYERTQQKLLAGETPQLGAASLQEIVKRLSEKSGIGVRSFRILEPKDMNSYRKISIHIDFNPVNSLMNLSQFINDIEHHEKELMISEMDLLVMNPRVPNSIQGSLVISGVMKNTQTKEKGGKKQ